MKKGLWMVLIVLLFTGLSQAAEKQIQMNLVTDQGLGEGIGTIKAWEGPFGLLLTPKLKELPPGIHGFHVHQNPDCGSMSSGDKPMPAMAAGGHHDPAKTDKHEGPYGNGHLGDLPVLYVDKDGTASLTVLAPRLRVSDLQGRSLMIHAGGDNYSDVPEKLGGGGGRIACGAIP